jgi:hypothetical protein
MINPSWWFQWENRSRQLWWSYCRLVDLWKNMVDTRWKETDWKTSVTHAENMLNIWNIWKTYGKHMENIWNTYGFQSKHMWKDTDWKKNPSFLLDFSH